MRIDYLLQSSERRDLWIYAQHVAIRVLLRNQGKGASEVSQALKDAGEIAASNLEKQGMPVPVKEFRLVWKEVTRDWGMGD